MSKLKRDNQNNKLIVAAIKKHQIRYDLEIIAGLVKQGAKVLDIGCGNGELLQYLREVKKSTGAGWKFLKVMLLKRCQRAFL